LQKLLLRFSVVILLKLGFHCFSASLPNQKKIMYTIGQYQKLNFQNLETLEIQIRVSKKFEIEAFDWLILLVEEKHRQHKWGRVFRWRIGFFCTTSG